MKSARADSAIRPWLPYSSILDELVRSRISDDS